MWIVIFLISYAGVVSPTTFSQTASLSSWTGNAAVVKAEVIRENNQTKIAENAQGLAQQRESSIMVHRLSRGRHLLYFCCPTSTLLNEYVGKSHEPVIQMQGIKFSLVIENNANAPPVCSGKML